VFGLFKGRNKRDKEEAHYDVLAGVVELLRMQFESGSSDQKYKREEFLEYPYCRGYVFGFCNCAARQLGIAHEDALADIKYSFIALYGEESGLHMLDLSFEEQGSGPFHQGQLAGERDYEEFLEFSRPPAGIRTYINSKQRS